MYNFNDYSNLLYLGLENKTMNYNNKTIWITGASSGIGKALAINFSKQDANLILSARNELSLNEVKATCKDPEKVKILPLDLSEHTSFDEKTKLALGYFNGLDMLVNNGGISQRSYAIETKLSVDKKILEVNYFGTIALTKAILPHFVAKKNGQIVVISSVIGKIGTPLRTAYAASKHALHGFFDSLRAEVYNDNITVTIICPGYVNTNVSKNALSADGTRHNKDDKGNANGMLPDVFAKKAIKSIAKQKQEVVIGGAKEKMAVYLKRFFPSILANIIRKIDVI